MKYTGNYSLKKPDGTDTVNVQDLNDNADTIDQKLKENAENTSAVVGMSIQNHDAIAALAGAGNTTTVKAVDDALTAHKSDTASTTTKGHVQLYNGTDSTSTTLAATAAAVKTAMDKANSAFQSASDGKNQIAAAITGKGVSASGSDTFATLASKIGQIQTGKRIATVSVPASAVNGTYHVVITGLTFTPSHVVVGIILPTIYNIMNSQIDGCLEYGNYGAKNLHVWVQNPSAGGVNEITITVSIANAVFSYGSAVFDISTGKNYSDSKTIDCLLIE